MSDPTDGVLDDDKVDPMTPVYVLVIYFSIYTVLGFTCSFISEYYARKNRKTGVLPKFCIGWLDGIGYWREYYHSFALHVIDEATTISALISMYCVCQDLYGTDINNWRVLTRQPKPGMILLISSIIWLLYKVASTIYLIIIDIFSWLQVFLHLIDCNYLYEMFIAHSQKNKNPIIQWMHRQYTYFCSIPLWFLQFVFLLRWSHLFPSTNSPLFICILLSVLFGLLHIFYVILWCDITSFTDECKKWYQRGFRLRFAYRGCQYISRMVWMAYFWIFIGSGPFFILLLVLLCNHIYLYCRGYLGEMYYILTKYFIIPDMSIGVGYRNSNNHKRVDWITKIIYILTHCAGCIIGIWVIAEEDLLFIDMLFWLHWFEDLILWSIITGICDQQPMNGDIMAPPNLWNKIWTISHYEGFYVLGIICWFFGGAYYLVLRIEEFIDRNKQSLSITQGILGLAVDGQWESLDKFLPRMKKISINRKNMMDNNRTAIHYAIQQNKWNIVKKLIEYGANVNIMDRNHQNGIHLICINKNLSDIELFKLFLNSFDGDPLIKRDNAGKTILHLICQNGTDNLSLKERLNIFMEIISNNNNNNKQIDVNIADNDGCTPLHYIVEETNEIESIEYLINNGAIIDMEDNKKRTPLIHAVSKNTNNPTTIQYLIENGANINHRDDKGWTPLHFAANSNLTDNVFILLEHFPNITIRNNAGKNAYNLANSMGYTTIADTLKMNMPSEELKEMNPSQMKQILEDTENKTIITIKHEEEEEDGNNPLIEEEEKEDNNINNNKQEIISTKPDYEQVKTTSIDATTPTTSIEEKEEKEEEDKKKDEIELLLQTHDNDKEEEDIKDNNINNNNKQEIISKKPDYEQVKTMSIDATTPTTPTTPITPIPTTINDNDNDNDNNNDDIDNVEKVNEIVVKRVSEHIELAENINDTNDSNTNNDEYHD